MNSMALSLLTPSNTAITYPQLSIPDEGISNYNVSQSVKYQVVINFTFTHKSGPNTYFFKFARLNNRMPNSSLTRYCPPYQESKCLYTDISGPNPSDIKMDHQDKFNNTYDTFNATIAVDNSVSFDQTYNLTLREVIFQDIEDSEIGEYDYSDEMFDLYCNHSEPYYQRNDSSLISLSNSIVLSSDNEVQKAEKICNWVSDNIVYNSYLPDQEMGALWAYNNLQGDCSEFSSLMVTLLRIQDIPARKVLGFVISDSRSFRPSVGRSWNFYSTESTSTILGHAWVEYYVPKIGWIACDPTWHKQGNYFNRIDFFRLNFNVGANFNFPPYPDPLSEFGNPGIVYFGNPVYEYNYNVEITVLEVNLTPLKPFPLYAVIFVVAGLSVILIAIILLLRRRGKKEVISYSY
jgi:hypothetical protein